MTLYLENNNVFTPWVGERIDDVLYTLNIENLWSEEDLAKLNLYKPQITEIPENKIVTSTTVERVDGIVKFVHTFEDYVETVPTIITRRQAKLALLEADLLHLVEPALNALPEPQKTIALIEWQDAQEFNKEYDLIRSLAGVLGLTEEQVDNLFIAASKF